MHITFDLTNLKPMDNRQIINMSSTNKVTSYSKQ